MSRNWSHFAFVCLLSAVLGACAPPEQMGETTETITVTPDELMDMWRKIPEAGIEKMDVRSATMIAHGLAQVGPEGLDPILEALESPETDGPTKVLAVISLTPVLTDEMLPRLMALTEETHDTTTRCCAIDLVGLYNAPEAEALLLALLEDPNHRVKTEAAIMLIMRGHEAGLERIDSIWDHPETTPLHKTQIALQLPENAYDQSERAFLEALLDPAVEAPARQRAAEIIGRHGGAEAVTALREAAETDEDEEIRAIAAAGVEAIAARMNEETPEPASPVEAQ